MSRSRVTIHYSKLARTLKRREEENLKKKKKSLRKEKELGASPAVHWLRLHASSAGDIGSIPGWATKIPQAMFSSVQFSRSVISDSATP